MSRHPIPSFTRARSSFHLKGTHKAKAVSSPSGERRLRFILDEVVGPVVLGAVERLVRAQQLQVVKVVDAVVVVNALATARGADVRAVDLED